MLIELSARRPAGAPWAMQMKAIAAAEPWGLVRTLTKAILACGGWVLSRGAGDSGKVHMLFEFERQACLDIYTVLIAAGVELSPAGHRRLTELCQCTCNRWQDCAEEIVSLELEIQTLPADAIESESVAGAA